MNFKFKLFALLVFSLLFLAACGAPLAEEVLFAGQPTAEGAEQMVIVDGMGKAERFGHIRKLGFDRLGNVYVYDFGAEYETFYDTNKGKLFPPYTLASLRRITPEGTVSTLMGGDAKRQFVGLSDFTLRGDILYTASAGCLLKANITEEPLTFEVVYGDCLTVEEFKQLQQKAAKQGYSIPIEENFWHVFFDALQFDGEVYYRAAEIPEGSSSQFKLTTEEKVINVTQRGLNLVNIYSPESYVANKDLIYYVVVGDPGPGSTMSPQLVRTKLDKPFGGFRQLTLLYEFSDGRGSFFGVDAKSNAYIRDSDLLKRIQPNVNSNLELDKKDNIFLTL